MTLRALEALDTAELAIRRNPTLAQHPDITRLLAAAQGLSRYLGPPLAAAAEELHEVDRPGAR